jgi:DNA-binding CsgD family transcriptional regulator
VRSNGGRWPLTGRDVDLGRLDAAVGPGAVVVAGAAGVGKSRLVDEWAARQDRRVVRVVATRAAATIPFGAFAPWIPVGSPSPADRVEVLRDTAVRLTAGDPPIVTVDDAHLLDPGSAALLLHLALHSPADVVATVRTGEPVPDSVEALARPDTGLRIDLSELSERDTAALVRSRLGARVHPITQQRLWSLALGNPMYLHELLDAALEHGELTAEDGTWVWSGVVGPAPRLVDIVERRVGRLGDPDTRALELVAIGEPLESAVLVHLVGEPVVLDLERRSLLRIDEAEGSTTIRLIHPLYAEVLRSRLGALTSRRHRRDLIDAVRSTGADTDPLKIALWDDGDAPVVSADVLVRAAQRARNYHEYELALDLATAASARGAGVGADRVAAEALAELGRRDELDIVLERLAGDPDPASRVSTAILRAYLLSWSRGDASAARRLLDEAIADAAPLERGSLASWAATFAFHDLDLDAARRHAALAASSHTSGRGVVLQGVAIDAMAAAEQGLPTPALTLIDERLGELVDIAPDDPIPGGYAGAAFEVAAGLAGRLDEAASFFRQLLASPVTAVPRYRAQVSLLLGRIEIERGSLAVAAEVLDDALDLFADDSAFWFGRPVMCAAALATACAQLGDPDRARAALTVADSRTDGWAPRTAIQRDLAAAWVSVAHGDLASARHQAGTIAAAARRSGSAYFELQALLTVVRCGGAADAADLLAELAIRRPCPATSSAATLAAALAADDGDALDAAAEVLVEEQRRLLAAEASVQAGRAHARRGLRAKEAASRRRAHDLLAGCEGATTPLLAGLGPRPALVDLTDRERVVARMAAAGRTNAEIAGALGVSVRTVNSHLNHAYAKLGTSDRAELAHLVGPEQPA